MRAKEGTTRARYRRIQKRIQKPGICILQILTDAGLL